VRFGSPGFGGPLYLAMVGLLLLMLVGALSIVVDVVRRGVRGPDSIGSAPARLMWAVPQVALLVAAVLGLVMDVNATLSTVIGALFLVCGVMQVAYLFRVVFPKRDGGEDSDEVSGQAP
jgi:tellurite resistance protein TehA-like permease